MDERQTKKVFLTSLGCPKNRVDSEVMLGVLRRRGYELARSEDEAEVVIVNTCSFIEAAKEESVETILELASLKNEGCEKLLVTGCLPQMYRSEIESEMPEVDRFLGTGEFGRIADVLDELYGPAAPTAHRIADPEALFEGYADRLLPGSPSAYLKLAEGCDRPCAFCIIPRLRGPQRSRAPETLIEEATRLAASGTKELILIAQDLTSYGSDLPGKPALSSVLRELSGVDGLRWIRLMYNYPDKFTDELIETIAGESKIVPYLDIPIQHVSDRMLKLMRRGTREKTVRELIGRLRSGIPDLVLRTTFIVGFPGETEAEFEQLCEFVVDARFERMGAFAYSREENTPAHDLPDQVDEDVKQERLEQLLAIQEEVAREHAHSLIGREVEVLVEGEHPETEHLLAGRLATQAPEIDGMVHIAGVQSTDPDAEIERIDADALRGQFVRATITDADVHDVVAEIEVDPHVLKRTQPEKIGFRV